MKFKNIFALFVIALFVTSCDYQKNNSIGDANGDGQKDLRAGDPVVYGAGPDSVARQTKNKYASKPEYDERTAKIREKMFKTKGDGSN
jgi:hypothetical protein